ncbi:MAG: aldehyde dehydrogenase, partial [Rhodobacteraceae bacterium]|nr:aldehyde dehydrogenase [Paracoccaceae bacterium]
AVPIRGTALAMRRPVGLIGALCADEAPLLGLVGVMAPAIAMGNRVVLVASQSAPLVATDFFQVLDTSDVPGGVVNILTGSHAELAPTMAAHMTLDAVWSFSSAPVSADIERAAAGNLKRTWVNNGKGRDWMRADAQTFLAEATETKTIWIPWGE